MGSEHGNARREHGGHRRNTEENRGKCLKKGSEPKIAYIPELRKIAETGCRSDLSFVRASINSATGIC